MESKGKEMKSYFFESENERTYFETYVSELKRLVPMYSVADDMESGTPWATLFMDTLKDGMSTEEVESIARQDARNHAGTVRKLVSEEQFFTVVQEDGSTEDWEATYDGGDWVRLNGNLTHISSIYRQDVLGNAIIDWLNGYRSIGGRTLYL